MMQHKKASPPQKFLTDSVRASWLIPVIDEMIISVSVYKQKKIMQNMTYLLMLSIGFLWSFLRISIPVFIGFTSLQDNHGAAFWRP